MNLPSFLWHDYETFGADPRRDRPAQFAALRTDENLEVIDQPTAIHCQPADDMLPQPRACLITGISPQLAREQGLPENEFAAAIHRLMSVPDSCVVGYNNFRFDDEVTRHLFWRNFFDPYAREYANGNSRFDLIDLMRMCRALRPEGLAWANRDDGTPSFRLEDLARANGLDTSRAHDALADVEVTLALARRLREAQPRLWDWALRLRRKRETEALLARGEPLVHSSSRFPASRCGTAVVLPVAPHPRFAGQWIVWNLAHDPGPFSELDPEALSDRLWTSADALPEGAERLPIKLLRSNRCPILSPLTVLNAESSARIGHDPARATTHARWLSSNQDFVQRLAGLFAADTGGGAADPELALYEGFVPRSDQQLYPRIRELDGEGLARLGSPFRDRRLNTLLLRYRARLYPASLDDEERADWDRYRRQRLLTDPELASIRLAEYRSEIACLAVEAPEQLPLLSALSEWPELIGAAHMA